MVYNHDYNTACEKAEKGIQMVGVIWGELYP